MKKQILINQLHYLFVIFCIVTSGGYVQAIKLNLIDSFQMQYKEKFMDSKMGGFSGLFWNSNSQKLIVVSDDRGNVQPPRYYEFHFKFHNGKMKLEPVAVFSIGNKKTDSGKIYDLEGILEKNGKLIFISEGDLNKKPRQMPRIFLYDPLSLIEKDYFVPTDLLPQKTGRQKSGVRNNAAFEGLALSPSKSKMVVAVERPLIQITDEVVQLLLYVKDEFQEVIQYPLDPNPFREGLVVTNGVSEVVFIDEDRLLVLERAAAITKEKMVFPCQIFEFNLQTKKKKLVLNLAHLKSSLAFENYEGMAIIDSKLLIVSDDNFSKRQKTAFLLFEIKN